MKLSPSSLSLLRHQNGFTMVEILTVMGIVVVLLGLTVSGTMSRSPGGKRGGTISQIIGGLDEARMLAIEKGGRIYFGIAGIDHPDPEKRLRAYILFRDQTAGEQAAALAEDPDASTDRKVAITKWETLPMGFFFDPEALADLSDPVPATGLPGEPPTVHAVGFGSLGQVETATNGATRTLVNVVHGIFNPSDNSLIQPPNEQGHNFEIAVYGLTGRVRLAPPSNPIAVASHP